MVLRPTDPERSLLSKKRIYDERLLEDSVKQAMAENVNAVMDYKAGKPEAFNFLVGQIMRKTKGTADAATMKEILMRMIGK